jgi:hypothetical protein
MIRNIVFVSLGYLILIGCESPSPIIEYNAAVQAYDRDEKRLEELKTAIEKTAKGDPNLGSMKEREKRFQDSLELLDRRINELRKRL